MLVRNRGVGPGDIFRRLIDEIGEIGEIGGQGSGVIVIELGEDGIDPGGDIGRVVMDGVGGELGDLGGGVDHGGLEALEALGDVVEVGGPDLVAGAGEKAIDLVGLGDGGGGTAAAAAAGAGGGGSGVERTHKLNNQEGGREGFRGRGGELVWD